MAKISKTGSTMRQTAYARRIWGAQGVNKKQIALDVGYAPNVANALSTKVENRPGFNNAIAKLAAESNNVALQVLAEFKSRGVADFSNKDLIGALNAIGGAWKTFNTVGKREGSPTDNNRLRTIILQNVENQTLSSPEEIEKTIIDAQQLPEEPDLDF